MLASEIIFNLNLLFTVTVESIVNFILIVLLSFIYIINPYCVELLFVKLMETWYPTRNNLIVVLFPVWLAVGQSREEINIIDIIKCRCT